jgi:hypothetical protein
MNLISYIFSDIGKIIVDDLISNCIKKYYYYINISTIPITLYNAIFIFKLSIYTRRLFRFSFIFIFKFLTDFY